MTLAVAFGWLSDRIKLKEQLAQERAEKEGLRAARDYAEQGTNPYNPWGGTVDYVGNTGWQIPSLGAGGEIDEATVEHLKEYLGGEPISSATIGGSSILLGGTVTVVPGDSIILGGGTTLRPATIDLTLASPVWPGSPPAQLVQDVPAKDPASISALVKLLGDRDATTRARAACTLARLGPNAKDAVPALLDRLKDADGTVRFHAAYALGRICDNSSTVIAALREAMNDNSTASPFAAQVLHRLDPTIDTVPRLIELLDHREAATRRRAAAALAVIGSQASSAGAAPAADMAEAIPKLKKLCMDHDTETSKQAMVAIARLTSPADAHAILGEVVRAGRAADKEAWTFASLLWNKLDRLVQAVKVNSP